MKTTRSLTGGWPFGLRRGRHRFALILAIAAISLPTLPAYADYAAGLKAYTGGDYKAAFQEWQSVAASSDAQQAQQAQHGLGVLYERGLVTGKIDMTAAISWYQKAADQGFADSQNNLAMIYLDGRGVAKNPQKAIMLWTKASNSGHTLALFNLGIQYLNGVGVARNELKAADLIARAAEGNLSQAQYVLGIFYRDGTGVKKDIGLSSRWLRRSAENGNAMAQSEIDQMPSSGGANPGGADQMAKAGKESKAAPAKTTVTEKTATQSAVDKAPVADKTATDKSGQSSTAAADTGSAQVAAATASQTKADRTQAKAETKADGDQSAATKTATATETPKDDNAVSSDSKKADTAAAAEQKAAVTGTDKQTTPPVSKPDDAKANDSTPDKTPPAADSAKEPDKAAEAAPAKAGNDDLANTGLKRSVSGTPAFAANQTPSAETPAPTNSQADKTPEDKSTTDKAAQDTNATPDKPADGKPEADKAETAPKPAEQAKPATIGTSGEIAGQSSSGAKEPLPNNTPVAESLDGPDKVYRIWLASKGTADSARSEWDRLLQKYPNILKKLEPDIRQYYYNQEQGSIYRLFVGPFTSLEAAQKICGDIHERYQEEFCRTVIN